VTSHPLRNDLNPHFEGRNVADVVLLIAVGRRGLLPAGTGPHFASPWTRRLSLKGRRRIRRGQADRRGRREHVGGVHFHLLRLVLLRLLLLLANVLCDEFLPENTAVKANWSKKSYLHLLALRLDQSFQSGSRQRLHQAPQNGAFSAGRSGRCDGHRSRAGRNVDHAVGRQGSGGKEQSAQIRQL